MRQELGLSQTELADLLGVSPRTVQSCEQGWRHPSPALERLALLLLIAFRQGSQFGAQACWKATRCESATRDRCLAFLSRQGHLCWFLTGNACRGQRFRSWAEKKRACAGCDFFQRLLHPGAAPT